MMVMLSFFALTSMACTTEEGNAPPPQPVDLNQLFVAQVFDGDTIRMTLLGSDQTIRFKGIDAPELSTDPPEPFAATARDYIATAVAGVPVTLEFDSACQNAPITNCSGLNDPACCDVFDRILAFVEIEGTRDLGLELIERGYAQVFDFNNEGFDRLSAYQAAEAEAQANQLGIWAP